METRANYILIGVATLAGILATFGFLLWLAKAEISRQYSYYDIVFSSVAGLGTASDVRFNGLAVGQVVRLALDEEDPSLVRVHIEVDAQTPIKTDTVAQLESQGVTGVSFVSLSGGSPDAEDLPEFSVIRSERSALQSIFEGAPELLDRAVRLLEDLQTVVDADNRAAVGALLDNLVSASGRLDQALADFEGLSTELGGASRSIAAFTERLDQLSLTAEDTLSTATRTLEAAQEATGSAISTLDTARDTFSTADALMQNEITDMLVTGRAAVANLDQTITELSPAISETVAAAQDLMGTRLPRMTDEITQAAETLEREVARFGTEATALMTQYSALGTTAQARLEESAATLAAFEAASVEARDALTTINGVVQKDLPVLFEDLRAAARTANQVIGTVGGDLSRAAQRLTVLSDDGAATLAAATETFATANDTLVAITDAMTAAQTTLGAADGALSSISRIVDEDLDTVAADVRSAVDVFTTTMTSVAESADQISGEVLSASRSASDLMGTVDGIVQANERQASDFLRLGLPQFQRFVEESRRLVSNLDRLVDRIERDPARFLLGTQASEFNR